LDRDRYALDVRQVVEVLPLIDVKQLPRAPAGVAGIITFRGAPVPVIDVTHAALGRPSRRQLSTRLVVVNYAVGGARTRALGLIVERATEVARLRTADFGESGIGNARAPYLGPVVADAHGLVQRIEVSRLLPASVRDALFK
jgi:chemotaxis-related protein WspB